MLAFTIVVNEAALHRLNEVVTRASEAASPEGALKILIAEGVAILGAAAARVWRLRGDQLEHLHLAGSDKGVQGSVPLTSDSPLAVCVRTKTPEWLATSAECATRFPHAQAGMRAPAACACFPLIVSGIAIGVAMFESPHTLEFTAEKKALLHSIARECAHALERLRLIDAEQKTRRHAEQLAQRLDTLQAAAARLAVVSGIERTARTIISDARAALHGSGAGLWIVENDVAVLCAHEGWPDEIVASTTRVNLRDESPLAATMRSSEATWMDREDAAARLGFVPARWTSVESRANVPLIAEGRVLGALSVTFEEARHVEEGDRQLLALYAVHAAQAIHRVRLVEASRRVAGRMTALQAIAARLGQSRGFDEVTQIVIEEATSALGASTAGLWQIEGAEIVLAAQIGSPSAVVEAIRRIGIDELGAMPLAVRTQTPQYLASRGDASERKQYNEARWAVIEAAAFIPLVTRDRLLGVIGLGFAQPRRFDVGEREMIELFAGHAADAIARARDASAQRLLAEASSSLAATLDARSVMQGVGDLIVKGFADWCFVDVAQPDGRLERAIVAHADPADREVAESLRQVGSPLTSGVQEVMTSQAPLLIEHLSQHDLERTQRDAHAGELVGLLRAQSVLCVPMSVGGRAVGAITWIARTRSLDTGDLQVAAQIARAAAASLENARLYHAEAASVHRLGKLYELTVALSSARTPEEVANATTKLGADATGALSGFVWMRDSTGVLRAVGAHAPPEWVQQWSVLEDRSLPAYRVVATGEPVWMGSTHAYEREVPMAFASARAAGRVNAFVALPLVVGGERRGVLALSWPGDHRFEPDERTLLSAIARSCEQALERAELYMTEAHARAAAEAASRTKDEFLAMLGHELRNPLAPIVTALELMRLRGMEAGARERSVIERQVQHLGRLVDDLLDISRITRGKIELRRTCDELVRAIEPAIDAVTPLVVQNSHQLHVDVPATGLLVDADIQRLSQVVRNLLTNAAKFTPAGGRIAITARADGQDIELIVTDNGGGIPAELLPRVFEPFVQSTQSVARSGGGLGLGLAIVKNIVELHAGSVRIESDVGTRVIVRLPRVMEAVDAEPSAPAAASGGRSRRVLVVDDNADAAALLAELVRLLGHEPIIAHDGAAALAVASKLSPDLAILDLGLPDMDGYQLAEKLKTDPSLAQIPVIALTGYGQASDRERSRAAGFVEHMVKPIDMQQLHAVIDRFA